jgi:hypothetical protein
LTADDVVAAAPALIRAGIETLPAAIVASGARTSERFIDIRTYNLPRSTYLKRDRLPAEYFRTQRVDLLEVFLGSPKMRSTLKPTREDDQRPAVRLSRATLS